MAIDRNMYFTGSPIPGWIMCDQTGNIYNVIKLRWTHTKLYGYRDNVCIYHHDGPTHNIHASSFSSILGFYSTLMNDANNRVHCKPYLNWRILSFIWNHFALYFNGIYKLIFEMSFQLNCKVFPCSMQYYPEDLVESVTVLKMWLLWWIWTLENSSTRWSDDI